MAPDIHTLTGAYALDALPEAERAGIRPLRRRRALAKQGFPR